MDIGAVGEKSGILAHLEAHFAQVREVLHIARGTPHRPVIGTAELGLPVPNIGILLPEGGHLHPVVVGQHGLDGYLFHMGLLRHIE